MRAKGARPVPGAPPPRANCRLTKAAVPAGTRRGTKRLEEGAISEPGDGSLRAAALRRERGLKQDMRGCPVRVRLRSSGIENSSTTPLTMAAGHARLRAADRRIADRLSFDAPRRLCGRPEGCRTRHRRRQPPGPAGGDAGLSPVRRVRVRLALEDASRARPRARPAARARAVGRGCRPSGRGGSCAPADPAARRRGVAVDLRDRVGRGRVRSRFQAVGFTPGDPKRRVVAKSTGVRWPPKDARNPRELEGALGALFASIVATGWEAAQPDGSWSERRFIWRSPGAPPATLRPSSRPPVSPDGRRRSRGPAVPTPCTASPGAARPGSHHARR